MICKIITPTLLYLCIQGNQLEPESAANKQNIVTNTLTINKNGKTSKHLDVSPSDTSKSATKTSENTNSTILIEDAVEAKKGINSTAKVNTGMYAYTVGSRK